MSRATTAQADLAADLAEGRPRRWRQLARRALSRSVPRRLYLERGPSGDAAVCLTFDDGPHPEYTPRLLDELDRLGAVATFFLVGREVERHPEIVRRIAAGGHAIGHHSYSHSRPEQTSARRLLDEVRQTRELLADLLGERPSLFRPPYGKLTAMKLWRLWQARQTVVLWSRDPKDFTRSSADEILDPFRRRPLAAGDVVLLHDNQNATVNAVPELLAHARSRGLGTTLVSRWAR